MSTLDDNPFNLPDAPTRGCPCSAGVFLRLLDAAGRAGWPGVYACFAEGETITETSATGTRERWARRRTLEQWLTQRRPDLRLLLDNACQERRDRLLTNLQDEAETIALGPGDITQDFDDQGRVKRTRVDRRNKLHAILKLLSAHDPDTYADRRRLDVGGAITHEHTVRDPRGFVLEPADIQLLPHEEQRQLFTILEQLETLKHDQRREVVNQAQPRALPAAEEADAGPDPG